MKKRWQHRGLVDTVEGRRAPQPNDSEEIHVDLSTGICVVLVWHDCTGAAMSNQHEVHISRHNKCVRRSTLGVEGPSLGHFVGKGQTFFWLRGGGRGLSTGSTVMQ